MNLYINLSATNNNICDDHTYKPHVMLTFPTFISSCCVFWIDCQRSGATKFPPNGYAIQPAPKPVVIPQSLPPGSPFSLPRITVARTVPMPDLPPHHRVRKTLRGIHRPRSWLQISLRWLNDRWTKTLGKLSKQEGSSHKC